MLFLYALFFFLFSTSVVAAPSGPIMRPSSPASVSWNIPVNAHGTWTRKPGSNMPQGGRIHDLITVKVEPPEILLSSRPLQNENLETSQQLDRAVGEWVRPAALHNNGMVPISGGFLNQVATIQNQNGEFRIDVRPMN